MTNTTPPGVLGCAPSNDLVPTPAALARWLAWAAPAQPSTMRNEPLLARLRERWPLDGGGEGPADYEALLRAMAAPREEQKQPPPSWDGDRFDEPDPAEDFDR